ncbi:dihydroxy-acid dehydratase [Candidatus Rariloculus sp.]|uniref:dihydroxy-acid dehydratase domain-containing protein n=1 Tax=Candidatus Rariloculus sp. TaxID=3101265 RepID=UPI003D0EBE6B
MKRKLRSIAQPGTTWEALRRAHWKAMGLSDEDLEKPKIAVVNSSSELAICYRHLDGVAEVVKQGVRNSGGYPIEIRTAAPSDLMIGMGHRGGYILPSRDLLVNDIEIAVEGAQLDGMVCLSSCDKTMPAHLMAAGRLNVPTLLVICGYQPAGRLDGEHVDIEDVFAASVQAALGKLPRERLLQMTDVAIQGPGVCQGMATANSMHIVCEVLGMTLPGSAPVLANSPRMFERARQSGERIVDMVRDDLKPREILTPGAFRNATTAMLAISGSINCIKHLQATAEETGVDVDIFGLTTELGRQVPVLCAVRPNGERTIDEFEHAGGASALLKQLEPLLDTEVLTVSGRRMGELVAEAQVVDDELIRPLSRPVASQPSIVVLRGSLAPESAILKLGARQDAVARRFDGEAIVFEDAGEAIAAIKRGDVRPGHALVARGMGPKGGPGMAGGASSIVYALFAADLQHKAAFITDGQLSGLCNKGMTIAEVSPEWAVDGPIALVRNGDTISIDVDARTMDIDVPDEALALRRAELGERKLTDASGYLSIYRRDVQGMSTGAVLLPCD